MTLHTFLLSLVKNVCIPYFGLPNEFYSRCFHHRFTNRSLLSFFSTLIFPYSLPTHCMPRSVLRYAISLSFWSRRLVHYVFHELCLITGYKIVCGIRVNHFNYELTQQLWLQHKKQNSLCNWFAVNSFFMSYCFIGLVVPYIDSNLMALWTRVSTCIWPFVSISEICGVVVGVVKYSMTRRDY